MRKGEFSFLYIQVQHCILFLLHFFSRKKERIVKRRPKRESAEKEIREDLSRSRLPVHSDNDRLTSFFLSRLLFSLSFHWFSLASYGVSLSKAIRRIYDFPRNLFSLFRIDVSKQSSIHLLYRVFHFCFQFSHFVSTLDGILSISFSVPLLCSFNK